MRNLSLLEPFFKYIDNGKLFRQPFQFLYYLIGVLSALITLYSIAELYDYVEYFGGIIYVYIVLMAIVAIALAVFTVFYWFRRAGDLVKDMPENARFQAIPAVSNLIITYGEWLGIVGMVFMFCGGILGALLFPWGSRYAGEVLLSFLGMAVIGTIVSYLVLIFFRLIGELILSVGVIANNARRIAKNTEKH